MYVYFHFKLFPKFPPKNDIKKTTQISWITKNLEWGMLEFCPKCEGLLMPKKEKSKTVFYCPHCGFEQKPKKKTTNDYKVVWKIEHTPKDEIIVVEGPKKLGKKDKELMKEEMEDYYRSMLEFYPEESE